MLGFILGEQYLVDYGHKIFMDPIALKHGDGVIRHEVAATEPLNDEKCARDHQWHQKSSVRESCQEW